MKLIKEVDIRQECSVLLQEAAVKGGGANPASAAQIITSPNRKLCSSSLSCSRQRFNLSHATPVKGEGATTTTVTEKKCAIVSRHLVGSGMGGINAAHLRLDAS